MGNLSGRTVGHFSLVKLPNGKSKEMALFALSNSLGFRLKENYNASFPTQ